MIRSVYFKLVLIGFIVVLPSAGFILYREHGRLNRLMDQQLQEHFIQVGNQILSGLPLPNDMNDRYESEARRVMASFNSSAVAASVVQSSLYKRGDRSGDYRLAQNVQMDKIAAVPTLATNIFRQEEFSTLRRLDPLRFKYVLPIPSAKSPDFIMVLQAVDESRPAYIRSAMLQQGLLWGITFLLLLMATGFVVHTEIAIPLRHLKNAVSARRKTALDPSDFGDFSELVQAIEDSRNAKEESSSDSIEDTAAGFGGGDVATAMFNACLRNKEEVYIAFFKANFADKYIKEFGRANLGVIKKITAESLNKGLPKSAPKALTEDFFFVTVLLPKDFKAAIDRARRSFNENILTLYELGQGKQVPIQTLSAFVFSNHAPHVDTFDRAVQLVNAHWEETVDPRRGGWAFVNSDGLIETSAGSKMAMKKDISEAAPAAKAEEPQTEPVATQAAARTQRPGGTPSDTDPALARKMFIVKLCRISGIKPRLAAQVYSAGWQKPDLLLQTKIQELSSKSGITAEEASELISNLRKVPKEKLAYDQDDVQDVFVTDVRMIRKISRESIGRWFAAGYRRIEDLRGASGDDLFGIDESVAREDIEAVLSSLRSAAAR